MDAEEQKNSTESLVEEDLEVDGAKADEVRGGDAVTDPGLGKLMQVNHEIKQGIVQNFRV